MDFIDDAMPSDGNGVVVITMAIERPEAAAPVAGITEEGHQYVPHVGEFEGDPGEDFRVGVRGGQRTVAQKRVVKGGGQRPERRRQRQSTSGPRRHAVRVAASRRSMRRRAL